MMFERKYTIKSLFNIKEILSKFRIIEFSSVKAYSNFVNLGLENEQEYVVNIKSENDVCYIHKPVILRITKPLDSRGYKCIAPFEVAKNQNECFIDWKFSAFDYDIKFKEIMSYFTTTQSRYLNLEFDYESFEAIKVEEFHKLYFYINELKKWLDQDIILRKPHFMKCWIDENLDLGVNSSEKLIHLLPLLNKNGEEIDNIILNSILQITDIPDDYFSGYYVDLDQNKKIMKDYYIEPYISKLITEWIK